MTSFPPAREAADVIAIKSAASLAIFIRVADSRPYCAKMLSHTCISLCKSCERKATLAVGQECMSGLLQCGHVTIECLLNRSMLL